MQLEVKDLGQRKRNSTRTKREPIREKPIKKLKSEIRKKRAENEEKNGPYQLRISLRDNHIEESRKHPQEEQRDNKKEATFICDIIQIHEIIASYNVGISQEC